MRRNEAAQLIIEDQIEEIPMEARIAKIESDIGPMKKGMAGFAASLSALQAGVSAANDAQAALKTDLANIKGELRGDIGELRKETSAEVAKLREDVSAMKATLPHLATKADLGAMETRIVRWFIFTSIAIASLAFSIARFMS